MTAVAAILFWLCAGLIVYTHAGYPLALRLLIALRRHPVETWPGSPKGTVATTAPDRRRPLRPVAASSP